MKVTQAQFDEMARVGTVNDCEIVDGETAGQETAMVPDTASLVVDAPVAEDAPAA